MIKEAIEKIQEISQPRFTEIDGRTYWTASGKPVLDPAPDTLHLSTLTGLADYLNSEMEWPDDAPDDKDAGLFITVDEPHIVRLHDPVSGKFKQRDKMAIVTATLPDNRIISGEMWYDLETFIIQAQATLEDTPDKTAMIKILGNVKEETGVTHADDGMTQNVTAKTGIATVEDTKLPNPVTLKPRRTFLEVEQPEAPFILRIKKTNAGPMVALFEADGGKWRLEAMQNIKAWLVDNVPEAVKVFA